jgi:hypothetical protein
MNRVVKNQVAELQDLLHEEPNDTENNGHLGKILRNSLTVLAWSLQERVKQKLLYYTPYAPAMFEHQSVIQSLRINHPKRE